MREARFLMSEEEVVHRGQEKEIKKTERTESPPPEKSRNNILYQFFYYLRVFLARCAAYIAAAIYDMRFDPLFFIHPQIYRAGFDQVFITIAGKTSHKMCIRFPIYGKNHTFNVILRSIVKAPIMLLIYVIFQDILYDAILRSGEPHKSMVTRILHMLTYQIFRNMAEYFVAENISPTSRFNEILMQIIITFSSRLVTQCFERTIYRKPLGSPLAAGIRAAFISIPQTITTFLPLPQV